MKSQLFRTTHARMRPANSQFYAKLCLAFGLIMLVMGIGLATFKVTERIFWTENTYYITPYLGEGIILVTIGLFLIIPYFIFKARAQSRFWRSFSLSVFYRLKMVFRYVLALFFFCCYICICGLGIIFEEMTGRRSLYNNVVALKLTFFRELIDP